MTSPLNSPAPHFKFRNSSEVSRRSFRTRILGTAFLSALFVLICGAQIQAQSNAESAPNSVADPAAIVISGNARFTILTPQLIRLEWAADGQFQDRPSLLFINRRMPVPQFTHEIRDG